MRSVAVGIFFLVLTRLSAHDVLWSMKSYEEYCESWTPWGRCSTCNGGRRHRQRLCPYSGNYFCGSPEDCFVDHQIEDCFEPCSSWGAWSCWKFCSEFGSTDRESRNRTCDFVNGECSGRSIDLRTCPIDVCVTALRWYQWDVNEAIVNQETLLKTMNTLITGQTPPGYQGATSAIDVISLLPFPFSFLQSIVVFWTTLRPKETAVYRFRMQRFGAEPIPLLALDIHNGSSINDPVISTTTHNQLTEEIYMERDCVYLMRSRSFVRQFTVYIAVIVVFRDNIQQGLLDRFEDVCFKPSATL